MEIRRADLRRGPGGRLHGDCGARGYLGRGRSLEGARGREHTSVWPTRSCAEDDKKKASRERYSLSSDDEAKLKLEEDEAQRKLDKYSRKAEAARRKAEEQRGQASFVLFF